MKVKKNTFNKHFIVPVFYLLLGSTLTLAQPTDRVFFTTGFKIGEVTDSSAVIWTRLCASPRRVPVYHERTAPPIPKPKKFYMNTPVAEMDGAVAGSFGEVKIEITSKNDTIEFDWGYVSALHDYTYKQSVTGLKPNTAYSVRILGRQVIPTRPKDSKVDQKPITSIAGSFMTSPASSQIAPITFTSSTCQYFWSYDDSLRGFKIYDAMKKLNPRFHVQTGDYVYYDKAGPFVQTIDEARHKWHAMNSWPSLVDFYAEVPLYIEKDDHDLLRDDAYPGRAPLGALTYEDGLELWYEQVPLEGKPYRTVRWGKDLQVWMVEVREYRSDNRDPDGKNKTIWGDEQMNWFKKTVESSDATFKVLISPTPIVGPDRPQGKNDNHSNKAFETEGAWLREYLAAQDVYVVNGDRHWQYVSQDPINGLMEFSQGAASDQHAGGWEQDNVLPEHRFLRVKGGFLTVNVYRKRKEPIIEFVHHDVDGNVVHKEVFK
ncbi:MAG: alkaline phosphatase D family protein [Bacteroidota bacterium]